MGDEQESPSLTDAVTQTHVGCAFAVGSRITIEEEILQQRSKVTEELRVYLPRRCPFAGKGVLRSYFRKLRATLDGVASRRQTNLSRCEAANYLGPIARLCLPSSSTYFFLSFQP